MTHKERLAALQALVDTANSPAEAAELLQQVFEGWDRQLQARYPDGIPESWKEIERKIAETIQLMRQFQVDEGAKPRATDA